MDVFIPNTDPPLKLSLTDSVFEQVPPATQTLLVMCDVYGYYEKYAYGAVRDGVVFPSKPWFFRAIVESIWGPHNTRAQFKWNPWADRMNEAVHDVAAHSQFIGCVGCANSNKCLAPDTPVLMYDGSVRKAKDIKVGDILMGDDSFSRTVTKTWTGRSNMVRIVPQQGGGDPWECNDDHILVLKRAWAGEKSRHRVGETVELSVKEYVSTSATFKRQYKLYSVGVEFPCQSFPYDARIYGIWLGDGTLGHAQITMSHEVKEAVIQYCKQYFETIGFYFREHTHANRTTTWSITHGMGGLPNRFLDFCRRSSATGVKRILPEYLYNNSMVRMELLAGLIDSDGCACGTYFEISSSNQALAGDIVYLARSLGFRVTVKPKTTKCNGKLCKYWAINIMGHVEDIPTLAKKCRPHNFRNSLDCTSFKVEQLGDGDWCGFEIDKNGRFLLGDFTVTHNTSYAAIYALVNWFCRPLDTLVLMTSTSIKDSRKRGWAALCKYWDAAGGDKFFPGKLVDSQHIIKTNKGGTFSDDTGIAIIAGERKKERDAVGKMIGVKSPRFILIADELPELTEAIQEAAVSNLARNKGFQMVGLGNFYSMTDPLGRFVRPKAGWESINVDSLEWETELGWCIRFDGEKSPNVLSGRDDYPFLFTMKDLKDMRTKLGANSVSYWRMCRSFIPAVGADDKIYSDADFVSGNAMGRALWQSPPTKVAFMDPGFTTGGDRSIGTFCSLGTDAVSNKMVLQIDEQKHYHEDAGKQVPRNYQIADKFMQDCKAREIQPNHVGMDATGGGMEFVDRITDQWSHEIYALQFGGMASDLPAGLTEVMPHGMDKPMTCKEAYDRKVSEIWFSGLAFMRAGQIKGMTYECAADLKARKFELTKTGGHTKIRVQKKDEMKTTAGNSPDAGDSFLGALQLCRDRLGFRSVTGAKVQAKRNEDFVNKARELDAVYAELHTDNEVED